MTARILRLELWRTNARWMALLLLPALIAVGEAGRGLTVLALNQRQSLFGAFPLAMGLAAWHARRDRRSRMTELITTTAKPRWQRVLPAVSALVLAAFAVYVLAGVINVIWVVRTGGYLSAAAVPIIAVGVLALLVPIGLGLFLGRWLPFVFVPPLLLVYAAASLFFGDTEAWTEGPGPHSPAPGSLLLWGDLQQLGTEFDVVAVTARVHFGQALWLLALGAAGLIAYACRPRTATAAVPAVLLGAFVAVQLLPEKYADAYRTDPGASALACTADAPRVCMLRVHRAALPSLRPPAREALAILAARLPDPPTTVQEVSFGRQAPRQPAIVPVYLQASHDGRTVTSAFGTVPDLRWELLLGAGTPACADPPWPSPERRRYEIARLVAAAWLLEQPPPGPVRPDDPSLLSQAETVPVYQALRALPAAEQRSRVARLRAAELACAPGDRVALLTGA